MNIDIPDGTHPALAAVARAAMTTFQQARRDHTPAMLSEKVELGADGTPTTRLDLFVDAAVAETATAHRVNLISEEIGVVDNGSATTLVVDPVDGTANAVAGVPLAAFAGVVVLDNEPVESLTTWLDTGRSWHAQVGRPGPWRTSGRRELDGAAVSLLRPHPANESAWLRVSRRAARVRILSSSCLEAALVAQGSTDAFADAGSDTHRIMDIAAAAVLVPAAGGVVIDAYGRPIEIDPDLTRRWSGIVAATSELAHQLAEAVQG
ncbi:inositol monophosphatase family protein [Pseudonocardia sp. HH130630-07]|uniref:inositol monophosphatase family protein n=1 Tax=Pseudonocardia sp. HH130630-07 TaxID=1690815 RepID=UPI00081529D6|nr:inositol monophosphatase family protein [Pseudonocardia sp. HH130630-07]ANY10547.1 inositol monophosphatase [Pseudonocardia sp. HH130630-07]